MSDELGPLGLDHPDIPWAVMDNGFAGVDFAWSPVRPVHRVLSEIAVHAERNPGWLELSGVL